MKPEYIRMSVAVGGIILVLIIETLVRARPWEDPRWKRLLFHVGLYGFNTGVMWFTATAPFILWLAYVRECHWGLMCLLKFPAWLEIAVTIIFFDLVIYWWHRLNHRILFLWRFHKVHHVDTHVDVTNMLRFHVGELWLSAVYKAILIIVWGPAVWAWVGFETAIIASTQFHHGNMYLPAGLEKVLQWFIVTPRYHAAHHTVTRRSGDNNFSTILTIWDRIFGSYAQPDMEEIKRLGLPKGRDTYLNIWSTLKAPFSKEY